jgi:cystathionine beta-lyase
LHRNCEGLRAVQSGHCWPKAELLRLAEFCVEHELLLCSDEIHADLVWDKDSVHVPVASLSPEIARASITLFSASKTFNVPGLCCAVAVVPCPRLRGRFRRAMRGLLTEVPQLGYAATEAAFRGGEPWRQALLVHLRSNRKLLNDGIAASPWLCTALQLAPAHATYLAWIDVRGLGLDASGAEQLFRRHGVGVSSGAAFDDYGRAGTPPRPRLPPSSVGGVAALEPSNWGRDHVRLNIGCTQATLEEAIRRLELAVISHRGM